jgi:hypothetical protein
MTTENQIEAKLRKIVIPNPLYGVRDLLIQPPTCPAEAFGEEGRHSECTFLQNKANYLHFQSENIVARKNKPKIRITCKICGFGLLFEHKNR